MEMHIVRWKSILNWASGTMFAMNVIPKKGYGGLKMIKVNNKYSISADDTCYTVYEYIPTEEIIDRKTGQPKMRTERYDVVGYCATLADSIQLIIRTEQRQRVSEKDMSLTEALKELQSIKDEIMDAYRRFESVC